MNTHNLSPIVYHTGNYSIFARRLARSGDFQVGDVKASHFPDGESYHRLLDTLEGRDVVVVGGTISDEETLELYDIACGAVACGARRLTLVIPYFGYSTMERSVKAGELVKAKSRARLISSIPAASYGNQVLLLDLHSEGIPHYFEGALHPVHIYAKPVLLEAIRSLTTEDFVLASTDAGRAKWVESLANDLQVDAAFAYKKRLSGDETKTLGVSGDVSGKTVIIYDDMIRTGGSLLGAVDAYMAAGATQIFVVTTHGVFPGDALDKVAAHPAIRRIICTDSHARVETLEHNKLLVVSVASLFEPHI